MLRRVLPLLVVALAVVFLSSAPVLADEKTHEGIVVSAGAGKLTMTDNAGKNQHSHNVAKDAKITCEGKDCKLEDLKKGYPVKVTMDKREGKDVAVKLEARKAK